MLLPRFLEHPVDGSDLVAPFDARVGAMVPIRRAASHVRDHHGGLTRAFKQIHHVAHVGSILARIQLHGGLSLVGVEDHVVVASKRRAHAVFVAEDRDEVLPAVQALVGPHHVWPVVSRVSELVKYVRWPGNA